MKLKNTLIISMLVMLGVVFPVNAADLDRQIAEMNRLLKEKIDEKVAQSLRQTEQLKSGAILLRTVAEPGGKKRGGPTGSPS